ncbi:MAG: YkvA family protein [Catenisphaera adipataccumulans]|jgi:uncharacterized membrane protein YkvA (DUF1232 family)|uniref:YkvA family protein n=1 Tax=Catenisphaera adipataccumulans TaxID=700500 RepID=UPI003D94D964
METVDNKSAQQALAANYEKAEKLLQDEDKMEKFLTRLEKKLKQIPKAGSILADVPLMILLLRSYITKEYTEIPIGSIIAIVSALLYFVSPLDLSPDAIPGLGFADDAAVIAFCLTMVDSDIKDFIEWRQQIGKSVA